MSGFGILISIGKWGGVWVSRNTYAPRIALGWVAITFLPFDGDDLIHMATQNQALNVGHKKYTEGKEQS